MPRKSIQPIEPRDGDAGAKRKPDRRRTEPARLAAPKAQGPKPRVQTSKLPAEVEALVEEFRARYPFPLDPFQEEAIAYLAGGDSVMVAAPTGTGKTVVAE